MGPRLKFLLGILLTIFLFLYSGLGVEASDEEKYFVVTAYYSPLPDQELYSYSSYLGRYRNYQEAVALQGKGTHGASGTPVFKGMLAGPKNYPFGTKVYLDGIGVGEITDRGGAIRPAGGSKKCVHDCIDIWVGYGDEGRIRALEWGIRTIKGNIVSSGTPVSIDFPESPVAAVTKLNINPESSSYDDVIVLQEIFTKIDLYSGELDGKYESIKNELINFQLSAGIIQSPQDESAGWYGPKTIAALREQYGSATALLIKESQVTSTIDTGSVISKEHKALLQYGSLEVNPDSQMDSIKDLQNLLRELGEYSGEIDGKYNSIERSLIDLQIKIGLVNTSEDWGAGYFGDQTKSALWEYYENTPLPAEATHTSKKTYNISISEQNALNDRIKKLKEAYSAEIIQLLSVQIDSIIDNKKYEKHGDTLLYIQDNL